MSPNNGYDRRIREVLEKLGFFRDDRNSVAYSHAVTELRILMENDGKPYKHIISLCNGSERIQNRYIKEHLDGFIAHGIALVGSDDILRMNDMGQALPESIEIDEDPLLKSLETKAEELFTTKPQYVVSYQKRVISKSGYEFLKKYFGIKSESEVNLLFEEYLKTHQPEKEKEMEGT